VQGARHAVVVPPQRLPRLHGQLHGGGSAGVQQPERASRGTHRAGRAWNSLAPNTPHALPPHAAPQLPTAPQVRSTSPPTSSGL
jgi:hypothetical protein